MWMRWSAARPGPLVTVLTRPGITPEETIMGKRQARLVKARIARRKSQRQMHIVYPLNAGPVNVDDLLRGLRWENRRQA